jgi:succinyl-CoA synthetase beta subunit
LIATNLFRVFAENDASLVEINPLVVTNEKYLVAADGKIILDDNALYRHVDLELCATSMKNRRKKTSAQSWFVLRQA